MKTVRKLSARSNEHFLRVVGQAARSVRQAEIARSVGLSETTISRLLRTEEAKQAVDVLRAQALMKSWSAFDELLNESIDYLRGAMKSPLVGHQTRARIALKLLELGLLAGALPNEIERASGHTDNDTIICHAVMADTDKDAGEAFPASLDTDNDTVGFSELHSGTKYEMPKDLGAGFLTRAQGVRHDEDNG